MILSIAGNAAAALQGGGLPWWVWLIIIVVVILVIAWAMQRRPADASTPSAPSQISAQPMADSMASVPEKPAMPMEASAPPAVEMPTEAPPAMEAETAMAAEAEAPAMAEAASMPEAASAPPMAGETDDLTRIEGIGPAIASALQAGGVTTFQQLADASADHVRELMRNAGIRGGDPATWAQQAKLAAAGDWAKLKRLQDRLIGGRRV